MCSLIVHELPLDPNFKRPALNCEEIERNLAYTIRISNKRFLFLMLLQHSSSEEERKISFGCVVLLLTKAFIEDHSEQLSEQTVI